MKKLLLAFSLILSTVTFSQEPFRYDTIRVSRDDTRNIHHYNQRESTPKHNQQIRRGLGTTQSVAKTAFDARNIRYGLNLGLNFSNNYSLFRLAPQVGYQFNKYVMAGAGVSYYYSKQKSYYQHDKMTHTNNSLGANLFGYLYPASFLAISVQPEANYIWSSSNGGAGSNYKRDVLVPSVLVGAGLRFGSAHAMLYYDLVQDIDSPYTSGVFYGVSVYF